MIFIITQRDPFFIDSFLREFDKNGVEYKVCNLPNFNKWFTSGLKKALLLYRFGGLLKLIFKYIWIKVYKNKLKNMVTSITCENIEDAGGFVSQIRSGDVLLSLSAPCRIPVENLPKGVTTINIHCGKLPQYAGMMPIFWQIFDGHNQITITFQELGQYIDTGGVIFEQLIDVTGSLFDTSVRAKEESAKIFMELIHTDVKTKPKYITPKSNAELKLSKFPESHHVLQFKKKMKLI